MRPRFQADADFNHKIVIGLRRREPAIDFLGAVDGGVIGMPDQEVLRLASGADRILVSHDRRTMPGHFREFVANRTSPGVLLVSQDVEIGTAIDELILIWATTEVSEWVNRIGYLPL